MTIERNRSMHGLDDSGGSDASAVGVRNGERRRPPADP